MKRIVVLIITAALIQIGCGKKETVGEVENKFAGAICGKMEECMDEMLKELPEEARAEARKQMPTGDKCIEEFKKDQGDSGGDKNRSLTAEEADLAMKCLDALTKTTSANMGKLELPDCEKLDALMEKNK